MRSVFGDWNGQPQLHSEYRSTYRWHEYTPRTNQVVRRPPQPLNGTVMSSGIDGSEFSRRKKHPDVAYRSHQFFDSNGKGGAGESVEPSTRTARPVARQNGHLGSSRRSKSEGPVTRNPLFQSEYRQQFTPSTSTPRRTHSHHQRREEGGLDNAPSAGQVQEPKASVSFPPPAPSSGWNRRQNSLRAREMTEVREPKKSISMGQIQPTGNNPASSTETKVAKKPQEMNGNSDSVDGPGSTTPRSHSPAPKIKEHRSEYKNRFRPFSQYEYIGDGKFLNTSTSPPNEIDNPSVRWPKQAPARQENLSGEPWYQEVIELRKTANDYKCRGWGTDLVPAHMSQIYSQQISLHEQAARRENLCALSLAISTPRSMNKDEKDKENQRKSSSPSKPRSSRPRTAPLSGPRKSTSRSESARPGSAQPSSAKEVKDTTDSKDKSTLGRSVSAGSPARKEPGSRPHSAKRQRPTTLNTSTSKPKTSIKTAKKEEATKAEKKEDKKEENITKPLSKDSKSKTASQIPKKSSPRKPLVPVKEETLTKDVKKTNHSEARDKLGEGKKGVSRNSSKAASRDNTRPPSVIDHIDYFREPVVKSPPEPTRVKSPEQLCMRSPDPINWTVPLDTRNTFSVTQSVRDSDSARNSPMSDHSSHFDSVSGTAINLGMHSVNEKGSLHYPKVSALAREAKELQGKTSQKEEKKTSVTEAPFSPRIDAAPGTVADSAASNRVNGTANGNQTLDEANKKEETENNKNIATSKEEDKSKPAIPEPKAPSSNLKCLDDPNFSFDEGPSSASAKPSTATAPEPQGEGSQPKKPSYRVLEDPTLPELPKPKGAGYKVLEDPMMTSIYEPAKEPVKGRPEEVADGARQQFDKFFKGNQI